MAKHVTNLYRWLKHNAHLVSHHGLARVVLAEAPHHITQRGIDRQGDQ